MSRSRLVVAVLTPLCCVSLGCQAINDLLPTNPSKASPSPGPTAAPLTIPVILPTPAPTPVPTPTPTPAATPTPSPTAPPSSSSCNLPASSPSSPSCGFSAAQLDLDVEAAIDWSTAKHPEYYDFNDKKCGNCYYVRNVSGYVADVLKALGSRGICATYDGEELAVKNTNAHSEQYDILLASGHMRRRPSAYRGDCRPAVF